MWSLLYLSLLLLFGAIGQGAAQDDYRLPTQIRPSKYSLFMRMVLDENQDGFDLFTAPGNVTITITCTEPTEVITLNEQYITILENGVKVTDISNPGSATPIDIIRHSYEPSLHFYKILLNSTLEVNRTYSLFIPFVSQILTNDTLGLYRGYYTDELANNVTKNLSTTFFQPFGGRRMFPCFDEPDMKATFEVSIARYKKYHTLANMDIRLTAEDSQYPDWEWDHFNATVPMSTYIICVIVSDFAAETADPAIFPGKPVKVWGTPAAIKAQGGVFAAEMGARLLRWYENFTGIPYALPKMDSIAIPQFAAGAMENWGLNTYRDAYLIYKPGDPESSKIGVAETLAHELSHQWFGNLATCQWWDQMWLNEGLATYFTYKSLVFVAPDYDTEMRYIVRHHQNSLRFDSDANRSHPVVIPTEGFNFFDGTSMEKGGSLTRMMDYLFTFPVLQASLRTYLQRNAYKGAVQDDLFQALQEAIADSGKSNLLPPGVTVKEIMDTWTLQTGYPLIRISRVNNSLTISQENIIAQQPGHMWWVPISVVTEDEPVFTDHAADLWIAPNVLSTTYNLTANSSSGWIIVNPDAAGFYRVLYDNALNDLIDAELDRNPEAFTPITRAQIVDDRLNLGIAGKLPLEGAIKVTEYLDKERNPGVLISAVSSIGHTLKEIRRQQNSSNITKVLIQRLEEISDSIGLDADSSGETAQISLLRKNLMKVLCAHGSTLCGTRPGVVCPDAAIMQEFVAPHCASGHPSPTST